jgi:predicted nucleic acid-binding protein
MTDEQIFFDTDCLSAFLWVGCESIFIRLYKNRIMLPHQVYDEIRKVPNLKSKTDSLIRNGDVNLSSIPVGSPEAALYMKLTTAPDPGYRIIGRGEASAISLAKLANGIVGSNNMRDIYPYIKLLGLKYTTSSEILVEALSQNMITEVQGNVIWRDMIAKQRILPALTFSDYLTVKQKNP